MSNVWKESSTPNEREFLREQIGHKDKTTDLSWSATARPTSIRGLQDLIPRLDIDHRDPPHRHPHTAEVVHCSSERQASIGV